MSHSSLGVEERRDAERAFAQAQDCVIVATSTLELGIDVGDLDHVIPDRLTEDSGKLSAAPRSNEAEAGNGTKLLVPGHP